MQAKLRILEMPRSQEVTRERRVGLLRGIVSGLGSTYLASLERIVKKFFYGRGRILSYISRRRIIEFVWHHIAKKNIDILLVALREPPPADHGHILVSHDLLLDLADITQHLH